jgi:hypothetical protein
MGGDHSINKAPGGFNITMDNGAPVITVSLNDLQPVIQCLIKRHGFRAAASSSG